MKNKNTLMFTLAAFILLMAIAAPSICMATQVTDTYRWSPARPEEVIEQFFQASAAEDYCGVKDLMVKYSRKIDLPYGHAVSVVGWNDCLFERLFTIEDAKLINIIKLDLRSDPEQNLECYQVVGDFKFKPHSPFDDGPRTFYVYIQRDEKDVWKMYAPEHFEWGTKTLFHEEFPQVIDSSGIPLI